MPKMDGFELYDKIKKMDERVKVFFISAFELDRAALSKQYPGLKIENFLPKPIKLFELIKRVEEQTIAYDLITPLAVKPRKGEDKQSGVRKT
jgi:response regulator RpfG family c-di-GMP phosphodiesterase